jgi:hypothetical protein
LSGTRRESIIEYCQLKKRYILSFFAIAEAPR